MEVRLRDQVAAAAVEAERRWPDLLVERKGDIAVTVHWRAQGDEGASAARDIEAITVNRWPHGYAYEYNPLWDPDWPVGQRPCDIARRRFGRIAIANSDAAAAAYTDQAIDQAYRAVQELVATS